MTKSEYADLTYFMIYRYKLVKNSDKTGTTSESVPPNTRHAIRNVDAGKTGTTIVFTTRCISINSPLNGRKVISWILLRENKMKI